MATESMHQNAREVLLEADAQAWAAFEAGIAAGRVVPFPAHLLDMVHPSIWHLFVRDSSSA